MLRGKSLLHVEQPLGKSFSPNKIKGYFNDLTNKVLLDSDTFEKKCLPKMLNEKGLDAVCLNVLDDVVKFGGDVTRITNITKTGETEIKTATKNEVAFQIAKLTKSL